MLVYPLIGERVKRETLYNGVKLRIGDICLYICVDVRMSFVLMLC